MNRAFSILLLLMLCACSTTPRPPFSPAIGDLAFRQTCYNALAHPEETPAYQQFHDAYHGNEDSLVRYFSDALKMSETPLIDGEGGMALTYTLHTLLCRYGDTAFARVLEQQPARTISAVGGFIDSGFLKRYPKTKAIINASPNIDFPLDKAYRNS